MQTFLPYKSFTKSAQCLDDKRLGKQRVEAMQILKSIYIEDYGWKNHPATKMWWDYPHALAVYMNVCIKEWKRRGFKNTMSILDEFPNAVMPHWLGDERLHDSHKSNLLAKDKQFYKQYKWKVPDSLPYYWVGYSKGYSEQQRRNK